MDIKVDKNGFEYVDKLPEGMLLACLDDFHMNGKKNIGMEYLIQWVDNPNYYEYHQVNENLKGISLLPFINDKRVFVKK